MAEDDDEKQLLEKLNVAHGKLKSVLSLYDPEKYPAQILLRNEDKWIKNVEDALSNVLVCSNLIEEKFPQGENEGDVEELKKQVKVVENLASSFLLKYQTKILTLPGQSAASTSSYPTLPVAVRGQSQNDVAQTQSTAARIAAVNTEIDHEKISEDLKALSLDIHKVDDWSVAESHEVEVAMSKIRGWKKQMKAIQDTLYSLKRNVRVYNLDQERLRGSEAAVENLRSEIQLIIENVEFEDESRCLFSLNESKIANVAFPTFSGTSDEDYLKFEREVRDCFKRNRVRREVQCKKLRELLKGTVKNIVPENLEDVEQGFQLLKSLYGDPSRVMKAKKGKLMALGNFPKPGSKQPSHLKMQLEWLLSMELLLKEVFYLTTLSKDMYCEIFCPSTLRSIKSFFPYYLLEEMCLLPHDTTKNTMESLYNFIIELREKIQLIIRDADGDGVQVPSANLSNVYQLDLLMEGGDVPDTDVDPDLEYQDDLALSGEKDDLYAMLETTFDPGKTV